MTATTRSWVHVLIMTLGLWTILSTWWLDLSGGAFWSSVIAGGLVFILGSVREWNDTSKTVWVSWGIAFLGAWLIVTPFFFSFTDMTSAFANISLSGLFISIFAVLSTAGSNLNVHQ